MKKNDVKSSLCVYILLLFATFMKPAYSEEWIMSVQKEDLAPFKHRHGNAPGGIEVDLVSAVAFEIGKDLKFVDYSITDGRKAFTTGEVTIDCCLNEVWFPQKEAKTAQVFSDPLYRLLEVWVFPKGKSFQFKSAKDLTDKRVLGIKGFNYPDEEFYGERIDAATPLEAMQRLIAGEADVAVLERHVSSYLINTRGLEAEFGGLYYAVDVSIRLHKSMQSQLPQINKAIAKLKESGRIDAIIKRNLR